jgi:HSP20 family protein
MNFRSVILSFKEIFGKWLSALRQKMKDFLEGSLLIPLDFMEDDKSITVSAELPDAEEDTIEISFENNLLTIRGESEKRKERHNKFLERRFGKFQRSLIINECIDENGITALYSGGTLIIYLPKRLNKSNKKYIAITKK